MWGPRSTRTLHAASIDSLRRILPSTVVFKSSQIDALAGPLSKWWLPAGAGFIAV